MLTNEGVDAIEARWRSWGTLAPEDHWRRDLLALVGELRAERTRTETLRATLLEVLNRFVRDGENFPSRASANEWQLAEWRAALAASVEETP